MTLHPSMITRVGNQSTTSTVLINMLTSIHVNVNPRDLLLCNQSIHRWGLINVGLRVSGWDVAVKRTCCHYASPAGCNAPRLAAWLGAERLKLAAVCVRRRIGHRLRSAFAPPAGWMTYQIPIQFSSVCWRRYSTKPDDKHLGYLLPRSRKQLWIPSLRLQCLETSFNLCSL